MKNSSIASSLESFDPASAALGWVFGYGCTTALFPVAARVRLSAAGRVTVQIAADARAEAIAEAVADRMGIDTSAVIVQLGDRSLPPAPPLDLFGGDDSVCSAVLKACDGVRNALFWGAVTAREDPIGGRDPNQLDLKAGAVISPDGSVESIQSVLRRMGVGALEHYAEWMPSQAMSPTLGTTAPTVR